MPNSKKILKVSELTHLLKRTLETTFPNVWVEGEISNFKQHSSGHLYFSLKDEEAQILCVMWKSRASSLSFLLEGGMKVHLLGSVTVYPPRGTYQLDVMRIIPVGIGDLQIAFDELKKRLAAEGLFDQERKKKIPKFPERIGVVTSPTGAAYKDIVSVLDRRNRAVEIFLYPVRVQGEGAAEEIAGAIRDMNRFGSIDVMIVGRGGGSLEDLWPFNEEIVARAIYASKIPVVSAVGHEIDFSISDFVADLRAPTPSAAAEMVVPEKSELLANLGNICYTMHRRLSDRFTLSKRQISGLLESFAFNQPKQLLLQYMQNLDELERSLTVEIGHLVELMQSRHTSLRQRLESVAPENILRRGYAIVRKQEKVIISSRELKHGDHTVLQFHDGEVPAKVEQE